MAMPFELWTAARCLPGDAVGSAGAATVGRGGVFEPLAEVLIGLLLVNELRGDELTPPPAPAPTPVPGASSDSDCRAAILRDVLVGVEGALPLPLAGPWAALRYSSMRTRS